MPKGNMENRTITKVEQILGKIRMHPEYSACIKYKTLESMREEADRHSSALEAESGELTTKEKEEFKFESYERLISARKFLATEGISPYSLSCLGNILEPEKNPVRNFRSRSVNFGSFEGQAPSQIIYSIRDLTERIQDINLHPIRRATDAHISLVQIHPYFDGNGRAARLLQDVCLESTDYPSGVIPSTDRRLYIHLMNKTLSDRIQGKSSVYEPSDNEALFQEFVESKILASVERLESELQKRRFYTIDFSKVNSPNLAIKIKHVLTGNRATKNPLAVHLESGKSKKDISFTVSGDIGYREIQERVYEIANRYHLKYDCKLQQGCMDKIYG